MKAPRFSSGFCFMVETLNKQQCEYVGALLATRFRAIQEMHLNGEMDHEDFQIESRQIAGIITKIDYPMLDGLKS
jgi:hypothetical protein